MTRVPASVISEARVLEAVRTVYDPCCLAMGEAVDIADLGLVKELTIEGGAVRITLMLTMPACTMFLDIASQVREAVRVLPAVEAVDVGLESDEQWTEERMAGAVRERLDRRRKAYAERYRVTPVMAGTAREGP